MNRNFMVKEQVPPLPLRSLFLHCRGNRKRKPSRRSVRHFEFHIDATHFSIGPQAAQKSIDDGDRWMALGWEIKIRESGFWIKFLLVEYRNLGNFRLWYLNSRLLNPKYRSKNPGSHKQLNSGIQIPLLKIWNPVSRIQNPRRGIQTPRLSWIRSYEGDFYKHLYHSWDLHKVQRLHFHMGSIVSRSLTKRCLFSIVNRPKCHQISYLEFADNCCIFLWLYLAAV